MALWIKIVVQLGKLHHSNPGISLNKEIKTLIHRFLSGSLVEKDQVVAEKILDHIWGDESNLLMKQNSQSSTGNERTIHSKTTTRTRAARSRHPSSNRFSRTWAMARFQMKNLQNASR